MRGYQVKMSTTKLTASSQFKSDNAESEREFHNGKENRGKYSHANENINPAMSHLNEEFDIYDIDELREEHYREKIDNHNKHNRSASKRWGKRGGTEQEEKESSMQEFLATIDGKELIKGPKGKRRGTGNHTWTTATHVSYLGDDDTLNDVLDLISKAGAIRQEIRDAYTKGYGNYILQHNEEIPTMRIYHADIHFDETTAHGHEGIVPMGHTKNGNPSSTINNALAEMYGYDKTNRENVKSYREHNDALIFDNITSELGALAKEYGLDLDFEMIRTGNVSSKEYWKNIELNEREKAISEREANYYPKGLELEEKEKELDALSVSLTEKERNLEKIELEQVDERLELNAIVDEIVETNDHLIKRYEEDDKRKEDLSIREDAIKRASSEINANRHIIKYREEEEIKGKAEQAKSNAFNALRVKSEEMPAPTEESQQDYEMVL